MNKKTIAIFAVCMVLVAALSVFTTLALLADSTETITNTFASGNVTIALTEAEIGEDQMNVVPGGGRISEGDTNSYMLYPGQTYTKDPMITIKNPSEATYVGMVLEVVPNATTTETFDEIIDALEAAGCAANTLAANMFLSTYFGINVDAAEWTLVKTDDTDGYTYAYTYTGEVADANDVVPKVTTDTDLEPLFDEFTIPSTIDGTVLGLLQQIDIKVTGYAVQAQNNAGSAQSVLAQEFVVFGAAQNS